MAKTEKNRKPRIDLRVAVQVEEKSRLQQFYSRNLSTGGIFLEVPGTPPKIGSKVKVSFEVPELNKTITADAEVVHHHRFAEMDPKFNEKERFGIGLRFLNLGKENENLIQAYVAGKNLRVTS